MSPLGCDLVGLDGDLITIGLGMIDVLRVCMLTTIHVHLGAFSLSSSSVPRSHQMMEYYFTILNYYNISLT